MTARDLAVFSSTTKANRALARSPHVIVRQSRRDATRTLWHLARTESADAIAQLIGFPRHADSIDWNHRNSEGATLLMTALKRSSPEVIDALTKGPTGLFVGVDNNGDNILHYVVDRTGSATLDQTLTTHPLLAGYIDLPNRQQHTPLDTAYLKRNDTALASLSRPTVQEIDNRLDQSLKLYWETFACRYPRSAKQTHGVIADTAFTARGVAPADLPPLDLQGILNKSEVDAFWRSAPDFFRFRKPALSRLNLALKAITEKESPTLAQMLAGLTPETLNQSRDDLIRAVLHTAHFPSVRVVAEVYREQMFAPLSYEETALHLAAYKGSMHILEWLFRRNGAADLLRQGDVAGCTPILRAAGHAQLNCIEMLAAHYPAGPITDQDRQGRGLLRTLFQARPASAFKLFSSDTWPQRITSRDKTATLAYALDQVLAGNYRTLFRDNESIVFKTSLLVHLGLVTTLLQAPQGQIDVRARISPHGERIIDVLQNGHLMRALNGVASADRQQIERTLDLVNFRPASDKIRALALAHL